MLDRNQDRAELLPMENLLTTDAAGALLGVSRARVRKLIKDGRIPAEKHGRDFLLKKADLEWFLNYGRKSVGRPSEKNESLDMVSEVHEPYHVNSMQVFKIGKGEIIWADALNVLKDFPDNHFQLIIADPPYYQVLDEGWDNMWKSPQEYVDWVVSWVRECKRVLKEDGLVYVFGQPGKREHVWLHVCSALTKEMQFHDMVVWDRVVGYNERYDSFTPQYEMILALRKTEGVIPYFDKNAVRIPYDEDTIKNYMRDRRYKDMEARERHLRKGKYATNILKIPSLKGSSKEKVGHPSQKPVALIHQLVASGSDVGDRVLDPFLGSGTTALVAQELGREWVGVEIDSGYVEMAKKRIKSALGDANIL